MSTSANETLVRRAIDAIWNVGDLDAADEFFAQGYVNHHGLITDLVFGPEAIKISAALHRLAFPDLHVAIDDSRSDGDIVVLHWTAFRSAIDDGDVGLFAEKRLLAGTSRSRVAGGRIVESWTEWDRDGA